ncbi:hypothetical protein EV385_4549 [Krasilnikovia cinnamomea]|uniref:Uncharacterized protein n=1 Tax=Krasilnikovia cinnamomea TaxID=349313 RepID=A0A4Q7ZPM7_9ACTN|nr:hypothetical protein [Krasilnikovia cinnamomea]RZU52671.1 hypothetical protein EV385_4549 [Krasilnikovia cinnamomea]
MSTATSPAVAAASRWLRPYLTGRDGPMQASEVIAAGRQAGHAERSVRRAVHVLGVCVQGKRTRGGQGVLWSLPVDAGSEPDTRSTPEPHGDRDARPGEPSPPEDAVQIGREMVAFLNAALLDPRSHESADVWRRRGLL